MDKFLISRDRPGNNIHQEPPSHAPIEATAKKSDSAEPIPRKRPRVGAHSRLGLPPRRATTSSLQETLSTHSALLRRRPITDDTTMQEKPTRADRRIVKYRNSRNLKSSGRAGKATLLRASGNDEAAVTLSASPRNGCTDGDSERSSTQKCSPCAEDTRRHESCPTKSEDDSRRALSQGAVAAGVRRAPRSDRMTGYFPRLIPSESSKRRYPSSEVSEINESSWNSLCEQHELARSVKHGGTDTTPLARQGSEDCTQEHDTEDIDEEEQESRYEAEGMQGRYRDLTEPCQEQRLRRACKISVQDTQASSSESFGCQASAKTRTPHSGLTAAPGIAGSTPVASCTGEEAMTAVTTSADEDAVGAPGKPVSKTEEGTEMLSKPRGSGRRRGGMGALFLTQRQCTGRYARGCYASEDVFRRRALSVFFSNGGTTTPLKMGRVAGSRAGGGIVRGDPDRRAGFRHDSQGVSCLEFDSMGALLAAGDSDSVSVYDFDEFLPQVPKVQPESPGDVRAFLQPTHCIQTRRKVSCVRWNPANENQLTSSREISLLIDGAPTSRLMMMDRGCYEVIYDDMREVMSRFVLDEVALHLKVLPSSFKSLSRVLVASSQHRTSASVLALSFLNFDDIHVFDLESVLPNQDAVPVLALVSGGTGAGFGRARGSGRPGGLGFGGGSGFGGDRGLGYLSFQFVLRRETRSRVTCVVAGGRQGLFRVWKLSPGSSKCITPYIEVLPSMNIPGAFTRRLKPWADVTAVSCITPDVALIATNEGTLATFSLHPPAVKAFGSGKSPDRLDQWFLGDPRVWGGEIFPGSESPGALRICWVHPSVGHPPWVVTCGLRSGRVVVFDTRAGRALGITILDVISRSIFCQSGAGGSWGPSVLACTSEPQQSSELRVLATTAQAVLDGRHRGGSESKLRPGPGWELGEAGGGGFRLQESTGYDICLPMDVVRAYPGKRSVLLSRDARAYLCPRAEVGLLQSKLVTSSVVLGSEEYSVEAMGRDGANIFLDRPYAGPRVRGGRVCPELEPAQESEEALDSSSHATASATGIIRKSSETMLSPEVAHESGSLEVVRGGDAGVAGGASNNSHRESHRQGNIGKLVVSSDDDLRGCSSWRRSWCSDRVRIFAKLKAIFDVRSMPTPSPHLGMQYAWEKEGSKAEVDASSKDKGTTQATTKDTAERVPWVLLNTVAQAPIDVRATAITCHPEMNFVLLGQEDGTISAVLPGKPTNKTACAQ